LVDSLKTIVMTQRALMLVCFTVLAFSFSAEQPVTDYQDALTEYSKIDPAVEFMEESLRNKYVAYFKESEILSLLGEYINGLDDSNVEIRFNLNLVFESVYRLPKTERSTGAELRSYFDNLNSSAILIRPTSSEIEKGLAQITLDNEKIVKAEVVIELSLGSFLGDSISEDRLVPSSTRQLQWRMLPNVGPMLRPKVNMKIRLYNEEGDYETYQPVLSASSEAAVTTLPEIQNYLYKESLLRDIDSNQIALPQMRLFWHELDDLKGDEIKATLEREAILESRRPARVLRLLGSELDGKILYVAAPLVIVSILFYMLIHVRHAERLTTNMGADEVEQLRSFPWIGLYHDKLSRVMLFLVVGVLPVVAVASAFYASLPEFDFHAMLNFSVTVPLILFGAILAMAIRTDQICGSIRAAT